MTNFSKVAEDEASREKVVAADRTINEYAYDLEVAQGINFAIAASDPDVLDTLDSPRPRVKRERGFMSGTEDSQEPLTQRHIDNHYAQ